LFAKTDLKGIALIPNAILVKILDSPDIKDINMELTTERCDVFLTRQVDTLPSARQDTHWIHKSSTNIAFTGKYDF
jgi:hypothetical protein